MQKDFVDPAMASPMLVAGGEAVIPTVAEAVAVARERGIFVVWVIPFVFFPLLLVIWFDSKDKSAPSLVLFLVSMKTRASNLSWRVF